MYFVFDENLCKFEGMTKEQIIAAIAEATGATPTSIDDAFITKIKEYNRSANLRFWKGTSAEYALIDPKDANTYYIITDDTTIEDIQSDIDDINGRLDGIEQSIPTDLDGSLDGFTKATYYDTNQTLWHSVKLTRGFYIVVVKPNSGTNNTMTTTIYFDGENKTYAKLNTHSQYCDGLLFYPYGDSVNGYLYLEKDAQTISDTVYAKGFDIYAKKIFAPAT